ncbi:MAG: GNAT family N-acetyltransferase [Nocardioides sp.]|nr:GNAT family N-acetyltransferase [Nocardioides sp.]
MQIRALDLADDTLMSAAGELVVRSWREGRPHAPAYSPRDWVADQRSPDSGESQDLVGCTDETGRLLGVGILYLFLLDNRDKGWLEIDVDPAHRRHGVGSLLLRHLLDIAHADGRAQVLIDAKVPFAEITTHGYRRFAEGHGFTYSNVEVVRHLALPVPGAQLDAWAAEAAAQAGREGGFRIETHVNEFPEELRESLCVLLGQLGVDAPTGAADFEEEQVTPQRFDERYAAVQAAGRDLFETVAVTPDGVVAAQTTIVAPRSTNDAFQWGTFVHREHRGHRLGLAVKVANLRAVQGRSPHLRRAVTQNAETNSWMVAINDQMGFEPVEATLELLRTL